MIMQKIAVYGAGGLGRGVMMLVEHINASCKTFDIVGFFDDKVPSGSMVNGYPVLGGIHELNAWDKGSLGIALAFGDSVLRQEIARKIVNGNVVYPSLIHPSVIMGPEAFVNIGRGCIICAGVLLEINIEIRDFVVLNMGCTVGHDVEIGAFASFMPGVNIAGEVVIGQGVYCGVGAKIINQLEIGEWTKIGAGAVVTKSLPSHCTAVGVPARPIKFHEEKGEDHE